MRAVVSVGAGLLLAVGILLLGPTETVVCSSTRWPNTAFGDALGHTDGAGFTGCDVPTGGAWALAGAVVAAPLGASVAVAVERRRARSTAPPHG